jgi:two-component system cell cycle sensor histidine kinase/response regulator CckA
MPASPLQDFQVLFESNPQPMWVYDVETLRFLEVNSAAQEKYGYSRDEFLAMSIMDIRPPEDVPGLLKSIETRDQSWFRAGGWRHRSRSGAIINVDITSHPVVFLGRRATLVIAIDVTERQRLETQLRHVQKMDALGRLAGGVAHDFNNIITAILGFADLVLEDLTDERARARIDQISRAAGRARSLTTQLLAFSRKQTIEPVVLDVNLAVEDAARMLRRLVGDHIETLLHLQPDAARVKADAGELVQILTNLVVNARDAMPRGGTLTIETANVALDATYAKAHVGVVPGQYVMIAVSDSGVGMSPEVQERLFEPFFTTKGLGQGTGLGLSTVYGIVRQRGGHVWVYSEVGRGTTIKIYLPRVTEAVGVESRRVSPPPPATIDAATILIVEDDDDVRAVVSEALVTRGYDVLKANTPEEAVRVADRHPAIHLLITDVVMPGETGPALAAALLADRPDLRVIYMSGFTDEVVVRSGTLRADATFLQKPFTLVELEQAVRHLLEAPQS